MAHKEPFPAWPFADAIHVVRAVDRHGPQPRHARDHVDFLAVAPRRLPDVLQLERPLFPRKADIVRTGRDPHASRHPFVDNRLRRGQIRALDLVILGTADRSRIHFRAIHGDDERVRHIIPFHAGVAFLDAADQPARQFIFGVGRKNVADQRCRRPCRAAGRRCSRSD